MRQPSGRGNHIRAQRAAGDRRLDDSGHHAELVTSGSQPLCVAGPLSVADPHVKRSGYPDPDGYRQSDTGQQLVGQPEPVNQCYPHADADADANYHADADANYHADAHPDAEACATLRAGQAVLEQ
jgi:hypothetical protein